MTTNHRPLYAVLILACLTTGALAAPVISMVPNPVTAFGNQLVGTTSAAQVETLTNTGDATLTISSISVTGNFSQTNTCGTLPATVAIGASCTFSIKFSPTASGVRSGNFTISGNAGYTSNLQGIGVLVAVYPSSTSMPQLAKMPLVCDVATGGHGCTFTLLSGGGSVTSSGIYTAPASNTTAVVRAVSGANTADSTITVSGPMATLTGNYSSTGPQTMNLLTFPHTETVGSTTRRFGTVIPSNYVPCTGAHADYTNCSGLILVFGAGGHSLSSGGGSWCSNATAGNEQGGWPQWIHGVPSPTPIMVCLESVYPTVAGGFEAWNEPAKVTNNGWLGGVIPNDEDYTRQIIFREVTDLNLNPRAVSIVTDWSSTYQIAQMAGYAAAANTDIVAVHMNWMNSFLHNVSKSGSNYVVNYQSTTTGAGGNPPGTLVAKPTGPINVLWFTGSFSNSDNYGNMCGTNDALNTAFNHPLNTDDNHDYWSNADATTGETRLGDPALGTPDSQFCTTTANTNGLYLPTNNLEVRKSTGGKAGTEVITYRILPKFYYATPLCSFDWNGNDTYCTSPGSGVAVELRCPPHTCTSGTSEGMHNLDSIAKGPLYPWNPSGSKTGYDRNSIFYQFYVNHFKASGTASIASISPSSLSFSSQRVSTNSPPQTITLTNTGNALLNLTSAIVITGDFSQTNSCGSSVVAGASCSIVVTFSPTATGSRTGSVTIRDDAAGSPHVVPLSGTGVTAFFYRLGGTGTGHFSIGNPLQSIAVSATGVLRTGQTGSATAVGTYSDATQQDITLGCQWASSNTGVITLGASANPQPITAVAPGTSTVSCTKNGISGSATVSVQSVSITETSVPSGTATVAYSTTFHATGGSGYTWTMPSGSIPGLTFNAGTATLSGTPTTAGSYTFAIKVVATGGANDQKSYTLSIAPIGVSTFNAQLPQLWVNSNECDPPGGVYTKDILLPTCSVAGFKAQADQWVADADEWFRLRIPTTCTITSSSGDANGNLLSMPVKAGATKCFVIESDNPNPKNRTACSHALPGVDAAGKRNPLCDGHAIDVSTGLALGSTYNDIAHMWHVRWSPTVPASTDIIGFPAGSNHVVVRDAEITIAPGASQSASGANGTSCVNVSRNDTVSHIGIERNYCHGWDPGDPGQPSPACSAWTMTGTVNTDGAGTTITWASGNSFGITFAAGKTITIAGNPYTIATVNPLASDTTLTLTGAVSGANPQTGLAFSYSNPITQRPGGIEPGFGWAHGCGDDMRAGIQQNGDYQWTMFNYIEKIHWWNGESHVTSGGFTNGPFKDAHNYYEGGAITHYMGGAPADTAGGPAQDVELRGNFIGRDPLWRFLTGGATNSPGPPFGCGPLAALHKNCPFQWGVKNSLEYKFGRRILIDGNVVGETWPDGQAGIGNLRTEKACSGGPVCGIFDATGGPLNYMDNFRESNNWYMAATRSHGLGFRSLFSGSNGGGMGAPTGFWDIINDVFSDFADPGQWGTNDNLMNVGGTGNDFSNCVMTRNNNISHAACPVGFYGVTSVERANPALTDVRRTANVITVTLQGNRIDPYLPGGKVTVTGFGLDGTYTMTGACAPPYSPGTGANGVSATTGKCNNPTTTGGLLGVAFQFNSTGPDNIFCSGVSACGAGSVSWQAMAEQVLGMGLGDNILVDGCVGGTAPTTFQVGQASAVNILSNSLNTLTADYPNAGANDTSGTTCTVHNGPGNPRNVQWDHITVVGTGGVPIQGADQAHQYPNHKLTNSIFAVPPSQKPAVLSCGSTGNNEGIQGTAPMTKCWDVSTFKFYSNLLAGRLSTNWQTLNAPGAQVNFFPPNASCPGATATATCIGFSGFMSGKTFPIVNCVYDGSNPLNCPFMPAPWSTNFSLTDLQLHSSSSFKGAASDGTDLGADIPAMINAMTRHQYVCPVGASCGATGPFTDDHQALDLLDWMMMTNRNTQYMTGTNAQASWKDADQQKIWFIKGSNRGYPSDIRVYDNNWINWWSTDNAFTLSPAAYKRYLTPVRMVPRFFTAGSTIDTGEQPGPNQLAINDGSVGCGTYNSTTKITSTETTTNIGHTHGVTTGPTSMVWGSLNGGASIPTITVNYFWGGTNGSSVYNNRERFYYAQDYGLVQWDKSDCSSGTCAAPNQTSTFTTLCTWGGGGGCAAAPQPLPSLTCSTQPWWIGGQPGVGGNAP